MEIKQVEVFSEDSNYAVMRPPGRAFPGAVIQGDSLSVLAELSKSLALHMKRSEIRDEELLYGVEELNELIVGRLLHYQAVLLQHDIQPPGRLFTEEDMIELVPDDE